MQKYPQKAFHRNSQSLQDGIKEKTLFPKKLRPAVDRAIRYVDYLSRRTGNPAVPLDSYSYYNFSGWKGKSWAKETQNKSWYDWISDQWGPRVVQSFLLDDPLTKMLREEAATSNFYSWKIPFDPAYRESSQLEIDFNSGPSQFIRRVRRQLAKQSPQSKGERKDSTYKNNTNRKAET